MPKEYPAELVALDIETTGLLPGEDAVLSLGLHTLNGAQEYEAHLRHERVSLTPAAMRVNRIDVTTLDATTRLSAETVDSQAAAFLHGLRGGQERFRFIPVGKNVGSFDMPFIRRVLPKTAAMFGYQALDINSICFLEDLRQEKPLGTTKAQKNHMPDELAHQALNDARAAANTLRLLVEGHGAHLAAIE